jgi:hypothetical protein
VLFWTASDGFRAMWNPFRRTEERRDDICRHLLIVGRNGEPLEPVRKPQRALNSSEFNAHINTILEGVDAQPDAKVMVFIHGGLNTYTQSFDRAATLIPVMMAAGCYPIFVNWRSGLVDCYCEHLFRVRQGRVHRHYWWLTWLYFLVADLGRAVFRIPAALYLQIINDCKPYLKESNPDGLNSVALFDAMRKRRRTGGASGTIAVSMGEDLRSTREKFVRLTALLMTYPFKFCTGPIIDAFGTSAWGNMLRRTKTLFRTPDEFDIRDLRKKSADPTIIQSRVDRALDLPPTGALSLFAAALAEWSSNHSRSQITVVGHSMGTLVLNRIIREFPRLRCTKLMFLAAACSIADFIESTGLYLEQHPETRVLSLCLHPIAENAEFNAFDLSPRGSLLVWIDNFMSAPETTADRRLGVWENIMQSTHMIPVHLRSRFNFKAFGVGKEAGQPQTHSALGSIDFWNPKYWSED